MNSIVSYISKYLPGQTHRSLSHCRLKPFRRHFSPSCTPRSKHHGLWINDRSRPALKGLTHTLQNPATRKDLGHVVSIAEAQDIDVAVEAAESSFHSGVWSRETDVKGRSKVLVNMAHGLERRLPELSRLESLQTGRPLREMRAQLSRLPEWFDYFAALVRTEEGSLPPFPGPYLNYVRRVPLGVCALLTPWNHPLLIAVKKLAPALAGGNSVVLKPPELAPLAVLALGEIARDAGLPPGVLNIVPGQGKVAGRALAAHPRVRKVDLTGGTDTGRMTACVAGKNLAKVVAELGGKTPMLVFPDVDVDEAVNMCAFGAFVAAGQTCVSGSRLLVHESIFDDFAARFAAKAQGLRLGDPLHLETDVGPLISRAQLERVHGFVERAKTEGAKVLCGGLGSIASSPSSSPTTPTPTPVRGASPLQSLPRHLASGFFYPPTVLTSVHPDMEIMQEEVFGPVVCLLPFASESEAVALANRSPYGLGASVHTKCGRRAHRVADSLQAGVIWLNEHHRNAPASPWGGVTAASGLGRENGREAWMDYTQSKSVVVGYAEGAFDWFSQRGARYG